jgi:hypothetical protein
MPARPHPCARGRLVAVPKPAHSMLQHACVFRRIPLQLFYPTVRARAVKLSLRILAVYHWCRGLGAPHATHDVQPAREHRPQWAQLPHWTRAVVPAGASHAKQGCTRCAPVAGSPAAHAPAHAAQKAPPAAAPAAAAAAAARGWRHCAHVISVGARSKTAPPLPPPTPTPLGGAAERAGAIGATVGSGDGGN